MNTTWALTYIKLCQTFRRKILRKIYGGEGGKTPFTEAGKDCLRYASETSGWGGVPVKNGTDRLPVQESRNNETKMKTRQNE